MASEKAPFRNLLREGNAQVTARSESEILPGWAGRMRKFAGSKASRNTCEVSETIARILLGVNSFLMLSKDNAPAGAPARRFNCDCRSEPISTGALTEANEKLWSWLWSRRWSGCGRRSGRDVESGVHGRWTIHLRETGSVFHIDQSRPTRNGSTACVLRIQYELEVNHRRLARTCEIQFFDL